MDKKQESNPVLQFSVLCDGLAQMPGGKISFMGVFSSITVPSIIPQFFIVNRWIYGIGTFKQKIIIQSPDLKKHLVMTDEVGFQLVSEDTGIDIISGLVNVTFEAPGVYWIEVYLNNKLTLTYPLPVYNSSDNKLI